MSKDLTGATLGKYQIVERLGRGGMADVYRAYQPGMERYVAIKIMHGHLSEDPNFVTRFRREAQSVGTLRHPNIVQVIDFDLQDDEYYMVMEYIQGNTLKNLIKERGSLPFDQALDLMIQLADAVAYAHSRGMIHRDIKPANVLMAGPDNPVLTDFGIAHIMDVSALTSSGMAIGTPAYISPEAGRGEKVDERADIYSLGIVLYEMLTGAVPYDADTPYAVILKHIHDPLPAPRGILPDLPESIERIILKALAKNRDDRYPTAAAFRDALIQARSQLPSEFASASAPGVTRTPISTARSHAPARMVSSPTIVEGTNRSRRWVLALAVVVVIAVSVGGVILYALSYPPPRGVLGPPTRAVAQVATVRPTLPPPTAVPTLLPKATTAATVPVTTVPAAVTVSAAATSPVNHYASLTQQVKQMIVTNDFDRALSMVEGALSVDPQSYDLLVLYGRACVEAGEDHREKGKSSADAALKIDPARPEAYIVIAQYYMTANTDKNDEIVANLQNAVSYLTQAVDRHSDDYYVYWLRARANHGLNDYTGSGTPVPVDQIAGDYEKAARFSPADYRFYVERGDFYFDAQQNYPAAQGSYERAVSLNQQDFDVVSRLAKAYLMTDQKPKAYDLAVRYIGQSSTPDPHLLADGAYLAWVDGQTEQAATWANRALSLGATTAKASYALALLAWDAKQYDTALARLDDVARTTDPSNYAEPFLNNLFDRGLNLDRARILTEMGRIDDAITAYGSAIKDANESWSHPYLERAKLYIRQRKLDAANQDLQTALTLAENYEHDNKTASEARDLLNQLGGPATDAASDTPLPDTSTIAATP